MAHDDQPWLDGYLGNDGPAPSPRRTKQPHDEHELSAFRLQLTHRHAARWLLVVTLALVALSTFLALRVFALQRERDSVQRQADALAAEKTDLESQENL